MLRITVQQGLDRITLTLEGNLAGTWVPELEDSWRSTRSTFGGKPVAVDLRAVERVDSAGRYLLALLHGSGAQLVASGIAMTELIRTVAADWRLTEG